MEPDKMAHQPALNQSKKPLELSVSNGLNGGERGI
jgi:hypothetical protein